MSTRLPARSNEAEPATRTVSLGNRKGDVIEMDIPVDATQLPGETRAAFHRRAAIRVRTIYAGGRTACACSHPETVPAQTAAPACTGGANASPGRHGFP